MTDTNEKPPTLYWHEKGCQCPGCQQERLQRYYGRGIRDRVQAMGNGIAYVVFGIIALIVALFLIRWAYTEYWITTHCTTVLGTRVCQ